MYLRILVSQPHSISVAKAENVSGEAEVDVHGAGRGAVPDKAGTGDGPPAEGQGALVVFVTGRTRACSHYLCSWCCPGEEYPSVPSADGFARCDEAVEEEVDTSGQVSLLSR